MKRKNILKNKGIAFKLIITFILLISIPLTVLGFATYNKTNDILKKDLEKSTTELNTEINNSINNYLKGIEQSVVMMSNDPNVKTVFNEENVTWMLKSFKGYIKSYEDVSKIFIGTKHGDMHIYPHKTYDSSYDPRQRTWYKEAVEKDKLIWTNPYESASTGKVQISAAKPVYNGDEFVGVLAITVPIDILTERITNIKIGDKGSIALVDRENKTIAHKNKEIIGEEIPIEKISNAISKKENGTVDYNWVENGKEVQKFAVFDTIDGVDWKIVATMYEDEIKEQSSAILNRIVFIGLIALIIAITVAVLFSRALTKNIKRLVDTTKKVMDGDFTVKSDIKSTDEIGLLSDSFNMMIETVRDLIKKSKNVSLEVTSSAQNLAATSEETSASAEEISNTVDEIAKGATEQANDSQEGASLVNNLDEKFKSLVNNSEDMLNTAKEVKEVNQSGIEVVNGLREETKSNNEATKRIENAILELDSKSKEIGNILETITSISEQTNLLALNASIEAARAGEHGKGFAVVANEIRDLAEGSSEAAEEIKQIVSGIQDQSKNTVNIMDEVKERSNNQTTAVNKANDSFSEISSSIEDITTKIESISDFVKDMDNDKNKIVEAIENISSVSEETAASSEEVSATVQQQTSAVEDVSKAAEKLNLLSEELNKEINKFRV
ncbi:MAG: methyl-accepting chemotaxis protein [Firmicutes bacterium]|nr:methyl-accepting chemotaxis protein [Bacillota bacterium]